MEEAVISKKRIVPIVAGSLALSIGAAAAPLAGAFFGAAGFLAAAAVAMV